MRRFVHLLPSSVSAPRAAGSRLPARRPMVKARTGPADASRSTYSADRRKPLPSC